MGKLSSTVPYGMHNTCVHFMGVDSLDFKEESHMVSETDSWRWDSVFAGVNQGWLGTPLVVTSSSPDQNMHDWNVWYYFKKTATGELLQNEVISSDGRAIHDGLNYA